MKVITARNVNDAFKLGVDFFLDKDNYRQQDSRNGTTLEANEPVTTVYRKPTERVLFSQKRDANPFFHFIEGLWMLHGRNDLRPLTFFVDSMRNFSDDNKTLWGAYGWRWRDYFDKDQLDIIIAMLKRNPDDRRAVLQMWDVRKDLDKDGKDVPCNTNIYFKIRDNKLNMTVCNRSNDMIWGTYGANAVHMSMLQEYMATLIGVEVGVYTQISDSFHVYENDVWERCKQLGVIDIHSWRSTKNEYEHIEQKELIPLITHSKTFHWELNLFFEAFNDVITTGEKFSTKEYTGPIKTFKNSSIRDIAIPMVNAYMFHKHRRYEDSYAEINKIKAYDWMTACFDWVRKRDVSYTLNNTDKGETHG